MEKKPEAVKITQVFTIEQMTTPMGLGDDGKIYFYIASDQTWSLWGK